MLSEICYDISNLLRYYCKGKKTKKENLGIHELRKIYFFSYFTNSEIDKKTDYQDCFTIMDNNPELFILIGVYDGHGRLGKEASNATCDYNQQYMERNLPYMKYFNTPYDREKFLRNCFLNAERKLNNSGLDFRKSGTTANLTFIQKNNVTLANVGNTRTVLCKVIGDRTICIELTNDHKADRIEERRRIESFNGYVERLNDSIKYVGPERVWKDFEGPGLGITRSIGLVDYKSIGYISEPDILSLDLRYGDKFMITATDGLWDIMNSHEACDFVLKNFHKDDPGMLLVKEARRRWRNYINTNKLNNLINDQPFSKTGIDDITCVLSMFVFAIDEDPDHYIKNELKQKDSIKKL